ncbi:putative monoglyceride lipase [Paramyrothecium foliicola]|nr:putative monoglyceride lipase [Paramyrothecium foliicola]
MGTMETTTVEGTFDCEGVSLYTKTWNPAGPVKAKLIFVHGYSDHVNLYSNFFPLVAARGIQVLGFDQRGWGRSVTKPAERGLCGPTSQVIADIAAFIKTHLPSDVPVFVMGHSMGGGEVLTLAGDPAYKELVKQIRGWILECPFIGFTPSEEPSFVKVFLGRLVGHLLPKRQMVNELDPAVVTRDPEMAKRIHEDPLCHNTGTLEGLASMLDRTALLTSVAIKMDKHVQGMFFAHATDDKVCSYDKAMNWAKQQSMEDLTIKSYQDAYHMLHADPCKEEFANDIAEWMLKRTGEAPRESAAPGAKL